MSLRPLRPIARLGIGTIVAVVALLVGPSPAGAAVTIGSDLMPDPVDSVACSAACTKTNTANPGQQVSSPIDGVVVRWRLRGQAGVGEPVDFKLRVLRPNAAGTTHTGINSSATRTVSDTALTTHVFPTQQAIAAGDVIGIDVGSPAGNFVAQASPMAGVAMADWTPPIGNDETLPTAPFVPADEILVNSDVEPDCDGDGLGDETQDPSTSSCNPTDMTPPATSITKGPKKVKTKRKKAKVKFEFGSDDPGASFLCKLDKKAFSPCSSPDTEKVKAKRKPKKHTFSVEAKDAAGNVGAAATSKFKVVRK